MNKGPETINKIVKHTGNRTKFNFSNEKEFSVIVGRIIYFNLLAKNTY